MIRDTLAQLVRQAAIDAMAAGVLPDVPLPDVTLERPRQPEHGDYASNLAMRLVRATGGKPIDIAQKLRAHLPPSPVLGEVTVAPPGFLNLRLSEAWLAGQVNEILAQGEDFAGQPRTNERVQIEFVSANPTGPLTVGNGRGAVIGSTLAAVLEACGREVEREYYVNDAGTQIEVFSRTLYARYQQLFGREVEIPADGYPGEYMIGVAQAMRDADGERWLRPPGEPAAAGFGELGIDIMVEGIRRDLAALGVAYDVWFRERSLYTGEGRYEQAMARLRERGYVAEKEGAVWFTSTDVGEDKDNVLVRSTGAPTYFASDVAYHYDKFIERRFDRVIDVWGADHHGHISRLKAAVQALGGDPEMLTVLLYQLVTVRRGGEVVRLSKRAGEIILLRDLIEEAGADACRFFFLQRSADSTLDFDIDLAKTQSDKNPVFYVQYAHARISAILSRAAERGLTQEGGDVALLTHPAEQALMRKMLVLPELLDQVARTLEPHHLPYYAVDLATAFHAFYRDVPVLSRSGKKVTVDVPAALSRARLKLVAATQVALARTLSLMGVTAPDQMARRDDSEDDDE